MSIDMQEYLGCQQHHLGILIWLWEAWFHMILFRVTFLHEFQKSSLVGLMINLVLVSCKCTDDYKHRWQLWKVSIASIRVCLLVAQVILPVLKKKAMKHIFKTPPYWLVWYISNRKGETVLYIAIFDQTEGFGPLNTWILKRQGQKWSILQVVQILQNVIYITAYKSIMTEPQSCTWKWAQ